MPEKRTGAATLTEHRARVACAHDASVTDFRCIAYPIAIGYIIMGVLTLLGF